MAASKRWWPRTAVPAALAAVSLALSGCVAAANAEGVIVKPGSAASPGGGAGGSAFPAAATGPAPGVTDSTVKIGYTYNDIGDISSQLGFVRPDRGDQKKQFQIMVDWANANGGIGGRKIEPVIKNFIGSTDSPENEEALCNSWAQDEKVFAVILNGQLQPNARPCYAKKNTVMFDSLQFPQDTTGLKELAPYYWAPGSPEYDEYVAGLLKVLNDEKFFDGANGVGIVANDNAVVNRVLEKQVKPTLKGYGVGDPQVFTIDPSSVANINKSLETAVVGLKTKGVDRVIFLGDSRLGPFFLTIADIQQYKARLAVGSYDSPRFLVDNKTLVPQSLLPGSIGISVQPAYDVRDPQYQPWPATDAEKTCYDIFAAAGVTFSERGAALDAFSVCDDIRFLKAAADKAGGKDLNAATLAQGASQLGEEFQSALGVKSLSAADRYATNVGYRVLKYDDSCSCYAFASEDVQTLPENGAGP